MEDSPELCILFCEDTSAWADFLHDRFNVANVPTVLINVDEVLPMINKKNINKQLEETKAVMLLISSMLLESLSSNKGTRFHDCIKDVKRGILFFLSVTEDELTPDLCERFPSYESPEWTKLTYSDGEIDNIVTATVKLVETNIELDKAKQQHQPEEDYLAMDKVIPPTIKPKPNKKPLQNMAIIKQLESLHLQGPKSTMPTCEVEQDAYDICIVDTVDQGTYSLNQPEDSYGIFVVPKQPIVAEKQMPLTIIPSTFSCESLTEACISGVTEIPSGNLSLEIHNIASPLDYYFINKCERINPYTIKFEYDPSNVDFQLTNDSKHFVKLIIDNVQVGTCNITFSSISPTCDGINQILLELLDITLKTVNECHPDLLQKLDVIFKGSFMNADTTIQPCAFENLFGIYRSIDIENSKQTVPTVLHLAAKYGFNELTAKLTDLPFANFANSIENCENKNAAAMARDNNYIELAKFLESYTDMCDDNMYNLYVKMDFNLYYNNRKDLGTDTSLYYDKNSDLTTRFPLINKGSSLDQDDYMIMETKETKKPSLKPKKSNSESPIGRPDIMKPLPQPAEPSGLSPELEELVNIQNQVKNNELTIDEARNLYFEWQRKQNKDDSFKAKHERMQKLSEHKKKQPVAEEKKKPPPKTKAKKGLNPFKKYAPVEVTVSPATRNFIPAPLNILQVQDEQNYADVDEEPKVQNRRSGKKVESGYDSQDEGGSLLRDNMGNRTNRTHARQSRADIYNMRINDNPQQLPPKIPPKGLPYRLPRPKPPTPP